MENDDQRILLALGRLEGKVDSLIARDQVVQGELEKLSDRMRVLEASKSTIMGACAAITAVISALVSLLTRSN
jgi:prefoldin subunit 5